MPNNIIPVLWCISQIRYGRVDIEEPKRRWVFDPLEAFAKTIENPVDRGELIIVMTLIFQRYWLVAALAFCVIPDFTTAFAMREISQKAGVETLIIALFVLLGVKVASIISGWVS